MKWFWLYFFIFLTVLILALGYWRPAALESAVFFLGWWALALLGVVLLGVLGGLVLVGWMYWQRIRLRNLTQRDGAYPLQRIRLRGGAVLFYDPNHAMSAATVVHPRHGAIEVAPQAGWDRQMAVRLAVERTRQLEAMYPGDDARMNRHGAVSDVPKTPNWKDFNSEPKRALLPDTRSAVVDVSPTVAQEPSLELLREPYTVQDGLMQNTRTKLVMGQTPEAEIVRWDLAESPHIRVHGKSQGAGKTNLIRCVAASALRVGHHVIVCDRRRFKDWSEFDGKAELVDVRDPRRFAEVATQLAGIYRERDGLLGQHGAPNISRLPDPPRRIVVVIAEFGALCAQADADGVLAEMLHPLTMLLREAGAAGVHVVIEDQVVDRRWPRGISTNAEPITGYLPQNYGAAGGYYDAHKLPAYTFHYAGCVFKSFDVRTGLGEALRLVGPVTPVAGTGVHGGVGRGFTSGERGVNGVHERLVNDGMNGVMNGDDNRWQPLIDSWFAEHPEALTGPAVGISDIARRMSIAETGSVDAYERYKGIAHKLFHEFRNAVRLPSGERLGADISREDER